MACQHCTFEGFEDGQKNYQKISGVQPEMWSKHTYASIDKETHDGKMTDYMLNNYSMSPVEPFSQPSRKGKCAALENQSKCVYDTQGTLVCEKGINVRPNIPDQKPYEQNYMLNKLSKSAGFWT